MELGRFSRLYAILDAESCARRGLSLLEVAAGWRDAGVRLVQYRDKPGTDSEVLQNAEELRRLFGTTAILILNDRVHLFRQSGFDGVHVGQGDASAAEVRSVIGSAAVLGISTHNADQVTNAHCADVSYVAVGPVFTTLTKRNAEPVVGLAGVRLARSLTSKPLVAIGGISAINAPSVLAAGADSLAVISGLLDHGLAGFEI